MKTYKFLGGGQAKAASFQELAETMREESFEETDSLQEFMDETAIRCMVQRGSVIRTSSAEEFIQDLIDEGFIIPV
ncbi:hypothetical protein [Pontibacter beigongshangensis]|uniref:hypothetical protein n=1 Tax=Pontibacter beigongshangensis TaxID=2574733 RepID=UPI00164F1B62|nr:hypothetical protein [Pontibacter beigongshangensis]